MNTWKLFISLMGALVYLVITGLWFFLAVPELFGEGDVKSLLLSFIGTAVWLITTLCLAIHIMQNAWPAPPRTGSDKQSN
ncbi:hypothetical protein [Pseudomonas gingeri]|uniref:Uncharacterized protein n=1 Tax=Pseudomonas gingeri TaxID=117681 RepID=A0A7Y8BKL8_9PSED|nr:hypothetical protein [Pseudomonas gingeri]NWB47082.1 hypothetical protein [Pseudomonas gingeri]